MLENQMIKGEMDMPISIGICFYCGETVYENEKSYCMGARNDMLVCDCYDCKYDAFKSNVDELFWRFADDENLTNEAIEWYFEEVI